eukprot:TRINITY_DN3665_c0_g2_i1.p1 TRINITY_DN3665_c0_g2~~TRINITY_DN3665_c0_g2_i1.p1  ORF type:complete len:551 (+),score=118.06 TRINITY_DN3665_c0_g2_i1:75-1727(+)
MKAVNAFIMASIVSNIEAAPDARGDECASVGIEAHIPTPSLLQTSRHVDPLSMISEDAPEGHGEGDAASGFHCDEAQEEWRTGWSQKKIEWCCKTEGIACLETTSMEAVQVQVQPPEVQGDMLEPGLDLLKPVRFIVEVDTAVWERAATTTGASMAFKVGTDWTEELELCTQVSASEVVAREVQLPYWPDEIRITALGTNAWGYDSIFLYVTDEQNTTQRLTVLNTTDTMLRKYGNGTRYWVDGDGMAPDQNTYLVPSVPTGFNIGTECTTREDLRIQSMGYVSSPPGTPCVFGVVNEDEGAHCIYDEGMYGSLGWCYTSENKTSWGACSENCPLFGPLMKIGRKVDEVLRRVESLRDSFAPASGAAGAAATSLANPTTISTTVTPSRTTSTTAATPGPYTSLEESSTQEVIDSRTSTTTQQESSTEEEINSSTSTTTQQAVAGSTENAVRTNTTTMSPQNTTEPASDSSTSGNVPSFLGLAEHPTLGGEAPSRVAISRTVAKEDDTSTDDLKVAEEAAMSETDDGAAMDVPQDVYDSGVSIPLVGAVVG